MSRLLISLIILFYFIKGQVIWTETFSNGCGSGCLATSYGGWTQTNTGANGAAANVWYVSGAECGNSAGNCGSSCTGPLGIDPSLHLGANPTSQCAACLFCPSGDCGAAYDASSFCICGSSGVTTNKRMESPAINCTGYSNIRVRFNFIHYGQPGNDQASFWYYNGSAWTQLGVFPQTNTTSCGGQGLWSDFDIALPASANNNPNVRIGFNWTNNADGSGYDPSFAVDDIEVYVKQPQCYELAVAPYTVAGCTSNCTLTEFSGLGTPCNGSSSGCGSCPTSGPTVSVNYVIPSGCVASVQASFERRCNGWGCSACTFSCNQWGNTSGCCNSGMDANDLVSIGGNNTPLSISGIDLSPRYLPNQCPPNPSIPSTTITITGSTITATGNSNGGARLFYSQTGGNVFIQACSNRMDEIITYSVTVASTCNCTDIILPLKILGLWAEYKNGYKELGWLVKEEKNISEYRLYVSNNGYDFEYLGSITPSNSQSEINLYTFIDRSPKYGLLYYKLEALDENQNITQSLFKDIRISQWLSSIHFIKDENLNLIITPHEKNYPIRLNLYTPEGKLIFSTLIHDEFPVVIPSEKLKTNSIYILTTENHLGKENIKIIY
ncbi:MAG: hypothetical protein N3F09_08135 [Bacteroidia bacterium]|nr:hypothetical protein [Bacteroidia bacterium]